MVASISTRWRWFWHPKSLAERSGAFEHLGGLFGQKGHGLSQRSVTAVSFPTWYIHRIPLDPLVCGFVIMVIYDCPCHQMPDGLKFFFTDLHLQPAMARVWANHGLVLASSCCAEACWPVLYCWESVYPNISPYSIQILITLCSPSCVKSDSYLGPPGQWQLGIFELQNSGKLHLGG